MDNYPCPERYPAEYCRAKARLADVQARAHLEVFLREEDADFYRARAAAWRREASRSRHPSRGRCPGVSRGERK